MLLAYNRTENVEEHAAIDKDVAEISDCLKNDEKKDEDIYEEARYIYENGKNSKKTDTIYRNLQAFSTGLGAKVTNTTISLPDFHLFKAYYNGSSAYADNFINHALNGTGFAEKMDSSARKQLAIKGIQYQSISMYTLYEFAASIAKCKDNDSAIQAKSLKNWDEGHAFYVGSLADEKSPTTGQLFWTFANKRCGNSKTCEENGIAKANVGAISAMARGKVNIANNACDEAQFEMNMVRKYMQVALLQGVLEYTNKTLIKASGNSYPYKELSEAVAFLKGVVPYINEVNETSAKILESQLELNGLNYNVQLQYSNVSSAIYSVVDELCIHCDELGTTDTACSNNMTYLKEKCEDMYFRYDMPKNELDNVEDNSEVNVGLIVGLSIAAALVIAAIVGLMVYMGKSSPKKNNKESKVKEGLSETNSSADFTNQQSNSTSLHQI